MSVNQTKRSVFLVLIILATGFAKLEGKSLPQAMLMSAILPGSGEIYAGKLNRGIFFTTADVVFLAGAVRFNQEAKWLQDSYKSYAEVNAGINPPRDNSYYELLQTYFSSSQYNSEMELYFRNRGLMEFNNPDYYSEEIAYYTISGDDAWQWSSPESWKKYKQIRRDKQSAVINRKLVIGAALANRLISILDSAFLVRRYNKKHAASITVVPDFVKNGAMLSCTWEF